MKQVYDAKNSPALDKIPVDTLLIDAYLADFFREGFKETDVQVNIGFAKEEFSVPSIWVTVPTITPIEFIGKGMGHDSTYSNRLDVSYKAMGDGSQKRITNIGNKDPIVHEKGFGCRASTKITVYSDEYDIMRNMSEAVVSLLLFNLHEYLPNISEYNPQVTNSKDPKIKGWEFTGIYTDYEKDFGHTKKLWSCTISGIVTYFVRMQKRYTYITSISETQSVVAPITEEVLAVNENEI